MTVTLLEASERAICPLCRIEPVRPVRRARSWRTEIEGEYWVHACPSCGLWATSPRPPREHLADVYPSSYHDVRDRVDQAAPDQPTRGRLLDIGCGVGNYLAHARAEGWAATGIELSPRAADVARRRGFTVVVGDATIVDWPTGPFERIRCAHTLEHVPDPVELLHRIHSVVAPEGEISIVVPNRRSVTCAAFRRYWHALDLPRHLWHFAPRDIRALAAVTGLKVTSSRHITSPNGLLGSVECVIEAASGQYVPLRERRTLRLAVLPIPWVFARLGLADVVEYTLARKT